MSGHNQITLQPGDEPAVIDFPTLDRYDYIIESLKPMQLRFDGVTEQPYKLLFPNTDAGPNDILLAGFKELERRIKASV